MTETWQSYTADTDVLPVWLKSAEFAYPSVLMSTFKHTLQKLLRLSTLILNSHPSLGHYYKRKTSIIGNTYKSVLLLHTNKSTWNDLQHQPQLIIMAHSTAYEMTRNQISHNSTRDPQ